MSVYSYADKSFLVLGATSRPAAPVAFFITWCGFFSLSFRMYNEMCIYNQSVPKSSSVPAGIKSTAHSSGWPFSQKYTTVMLSVSARSYHLVGI